MDVYSPSHPTDQDMDVETLGDQLTPIEEDAVLNTCRNNSSICITEPVSFIIPVIDRPTRNEFFPLFDQDKIIGANNADIIDPKTPVESFETATKDAFESEAIYSDVLEGIKNSASTLTCDDAEIPDLYATSNTPTSEFFTHDSKDQMVINTQTRAPELEDVEEKSDHCSKDKTKITALKYDTGKLNLEENSRRDFKDRTEGKLFRSDHGKLNSGANTKPDSKDKSDRISSKGDRVKYNSEDTTKHDSKDKSGKSSIDENCKRDAKEKGETKTYKNDNEKSITEEYNNKDTKSVKDEASKTSADKNASSHSKSDKNHHSSRHYKSRTSRNCSRTPSIRHRSKSRDRRRSRRRSSSHSRRRHSKSRSRERKRRRSRSNSRNRRSQRSRDSKRSHRSRSGSCNRLERRPQNDTQKLHRDKPEEPDIPKLENIKFSPQPCPPPQSMDPVDNLHFESKPVDPHWDDGDDMEETSTPDISEDQPRSMQNLIDAQFDQDMMRGDFAAAFVLHNQPPPPPPQTTAPEFINWQPNYLNSQNEHQRPFSQATGQFLGGFPNQAFYPSGQEMPSQHGLNPVYQHTQLNSFPPGNPHSQVMAMNAMPINPLMGFGGLVTQPPPPPAIPPMGFGVPPPPPFIQQFQPPPMPPQIVSAGRKYYEKAPVDFQARNSELRPSRSRFSDAAITQEAPNLLETLMSKAGLPANSISGLGSSHQQSIPPPHIPLPESIEDKSPMKKINKLLNTAANTLLSHLNEAHKALPGNISPPPPPPPLPLPNNPSHSFSASPSKPFVPPPLPTISGDVFDMNVIGNGGGNPQIEPKKHRHLADYDVHEMLAKRRRSEFATTREWQERIALEVKSFIKPTYAAGKLSKDDCRAILKKSVTKISRSRCTSINTKKIGEFTKAYVKKYYKYRKWQQKQRAATEAQTPIVQ